MHVKICDSARDYALDYRCDGCGLRAMALVTGIGRGYASALHDDTVTRERAGDEARLHAERTLLFVSCPACEHTSAAGGAMKWRIFFQHAGLAAAMVALGGLVALFTDADPELFSAAMLIMTPLALLATLMTYITHAQPWQEVGERVRFRKQ